VYQTYRSHDFEWDSGAFMGGHDLRTKAKAHFDYFLFRYIKTMDPDYLSCIAGMVDGIVSPIEHRSKTLQHTAYAVRQDRAVDAFLKWYMTPMVNNTSGLMIF
jgi:hypothetical protein